MSSGLSSILPCIFSVTVPIFNDVSRKKNHSSSGTPICSVFGLVSRICPDLPISAAICLCIDGQTLFKILSVYTKNYWRLGLCAGGAYDAPPDPQVGPSTAWVWGSSWRSPRLSSRTLDSLLLYRSHLMIRAFGTCCGLWCPNYGHLIQQSPRVPNWDCQLGKVELYGCVCVLMNRWIVSNCFRSACVFSFPDVMMPAYKVSRWWAAFYIVYISLELFLFMNLVSTSLCFPRDWLIDCKT